MPKEKGVIALAPLLLLVAGVAVAVILHNYYPNLLPKDYKVGAVGAWTRYTIDNTTNGADGVRIADVNSDGLFDATTGFETGNQTKAFIHPGVASVKNPWPKVKVGTTPVVEDAVFADMDGDGNQDVISSTQSSNNKIYINWAPGNPADYLNEALWVTQEIPASVGIADWMYAVALQIDGQNGLDIVAGTKGASGQISWFKAPADPKNNPNGWVRYKISSAKWIMSVMPSDMDGDGDMDVVVSDRKGAGTKGARWLNNPGPGLSQEGLWENIIMGATSGGEVMFMNLTDLDVDGLMDAVVAVRASGSTPEQFFYLRRLNGTGRSWASYTVPFPAETGTAKGIAAGDIDKDTDIDVVLSTENASGKHGIFWMSYQGSTPINATWDFHELSGIEGGKYDLVQLVDLDADNDLDVMTTEEFNNFGVIWYENPTLGSGGQSPSATPTPAGPTNTPTPTPTPTNTPTPTPTPAGGSCDPGTLGTNLSAYWKMDEASGTNVADSSGNGKNGTKLSATEPNPIAAIMSNGNDFDGVNDRINVSSPALPTGDFTYSAWVNTDTLSAIRTIYSSADGAATNEIGIKVATTGKVQVFSANTLRLTTTTVLTAGTWYHLAIVRSGSTITAYINGTADATTGTDSTTLNFGSCGLVFGTRQPANCGNSNTEPMDGKVDEAGIWSRALSASEVSALYNSGAACRPNGI